ncbi:hypothetical protein GLA29479_3230 [Lysobacter antibioticus]|uniref:Uncharacterized protein n=1 Tax=Lysobacter antibioticus TaxID=84531 RepID=A0A0S2DZQ9_LYSAN|nr:hypothetical protein GLA29479_3230 [Lysobacter antibioticus]ALN79948.1 hypothetical protein LA76x_1796 [Lysobacter antibioticus]
MRGLSSFRPRPKASSHGRPVRLHGWTLAVAAALPPSAISHTHTT